MPRGGPRRLRAGSHRAPGAAVAFLALALAACGGESSPAAKSTPVDPVAGFAGASACVSCHEKASREWAASPHGRHATPAKGAVEGFEKAVGSHWMQAYLRRDASGLDRILPQCLDLRTGSTRFVAQVLAEIAGTWDEDSFTPVSAAPAPLSRRSFQSDCSGCHASQATLSLDEGRGRFDARMVDGSINCETCHGPGAAHVRAWKRLDAKAPLVRLETQTPRESVAVCARCHGGVPAVADYGPQDAGSWLAILSDHRGLYPDGRASGQVYQAVQFVQSPCYRKGGLTCNDCHAAHGPELRTQDTDALCTRCHAKEASKDHTHHEPSGAGARCLECHMPRLLKGFTAHQRDHTLGIPLPAVASSPDACTACHEGKAKAWASEAWQRWWGEPPAATIEAAAAIAAARRGRTDREALSRALSHKNPWVRAAAAFHLSDGTKIATDEAPEVRLLAPNLLPDGPAGTAVLTRLLADPEPLVRASAATELARRGSPLPPAHVVDAVVASRHARHAADVRRALAEAAGNAGHSDEQTRWLVEVFLAAPLDGGAAAMAADGLSRLGREATARALLSAICRALPVGEDRSRLEALFVQHGGTRASLADHP